MIKLRGTGTIAKRPIVNHHLLFAPGSEWFCAQEDANYGCMILKNGVLARGNGAVLHESSWSRIRPPDIREPAIVIFQPYEDYRSKHHEGLVAQHRHRWFSFQGRQDQIWRRRRAINLNARQL